MLLKSSSRKRGRYNSNVKKRLAAAALYLCLAGCSYQQLNEYSVFKYQTDDTLAGTTLKTLGNVLPWTGELVMAGTAGALVLGFFAGISYLQSRG